MRKRNDIIFEDAKLATYIWYDESIESIGTIQIFHGMAEHILRYNDFAEELVKKGFTVIGHDHYAHGESTSIDKIGVIETGDFISKIIDACKTVREYYEKHFKSTKSYLFAHSMGSMAAQRYIEIYPEDFDKVILCGTDIGSLKYRLAKTLTKYLIKKYGPISYTKIVNNLSMKPFNKRFKQDHPEFGWLSANKTNIINYENDPYCGATFPTNYYHSISRCLIDAGKKENLNLIRKDLKILFIAGKEDPVTNYSKSTEKILRRFKKLNIEAKATIYYGARHELLNEEQITKNEVTNDIINFYLE